MFTLDQMKRIVEAYHYPFNQLKMIHVGGTNGKGSTSTMLYHIFKEKYQVGLYTSPYDMKRFDNIKINEKAISDLEIKAYINQYQKDFDDFKLSEFEIDTWIALMWFYDQKVDYAVIEVGLGGKDDATNVITPILSIITNIGYDHVDILGHDIKDIAAIKAGIIKPYVPVLIGPNMDVKAKKIIQEIANLNKAKYVETTLLPLHHEHPLEMTYHQRSITLNHLPYYQHANISTVIHAIDIINQSNHVIDDEMIEKGLLSFHLPKRFEILRQEPLLIMDGAHNLEGIQMLITSIKALQLNLKPTIIFGVLKDKPYEDMLRALNQISNDIHLFSFEHERALDIDLVTFPWINKHHDVSDIKQVIHNPLTIITGSLYFLRAVKNKLKEISL